MSSFSIKGIKEKIAYYSRYNFLLDQQIRKIAQADKTNRSELKELMEKQVMKLIRNSASDSAFYKKLYTSIDLNGPFNQVYPSLPVITKADVKANTMEIPTVPVRFLKQAFTSGTSGSPLVVYRSPVCILKENAYLSYFKISHGLNIGDPIISMRGNLDNKTLHYYNKSENTLYLSSYLLTKTNIKTYAQLIADFKPKGILSYPSSLFTLVNLLEETGLKAHIPLLFTSSETFYPFQKEKIEKVLGGKSFDWYGNAERSLALGQCEAGNYHEMPLYSINEFTGDGAIATSLINKSFPLIRYHVEDTFQMMTTECACGRGTGISSVEGRVDDVVMFYDGSQVGRLGLAFQGINNLRYAQIIQEDLAGITVNLVTTPEFTKADQDLILKKLKLRLNNSLIITFNKVQEDAIIKTKAGKYKLVISRLPR